MTSISQNSQNLPTAKKMLLDMREEAYNKQKDMRKHIEIRVSELMDKEGTPTEDRTVDSFVNKNTHPNVSVKILEEYQLRQTTPKKPLGLSRSREKIKSVSSTGTHSSEQLDTRIGDLFKWQERVNKKHEMQREFQEQVKSSMYDYKVYTNDLSNQMLEPIRPNVKVENILLLKGKAKELKIKKIEQQLYGGDRVPTITKMAQKMSTNRSQKVHTRLYDLDKHKREKSRETLSRTQSNIDNFDSRQRSKSEGKRKPALSSYSSAPRGTNFDFGFSPRELTSPITTNSNQTRNENTLSLQPTVVTSPSDFLSPMYSVKNADHKNLQVQQSLDKSNEEIFSPFYPSPVNAKQKALAQQKNGPISIYKRLTPASKNTFNSYERPTQMSHQNSNESLQKSASHNANESVNQQQSFNQHQSQSQKMKKTPGMSASESTPVLPNMLFFKNTDQQSSTHANKVHLNHAGQKGLESSQKEHFDLKSMEVFWDKILQDDSEGKGRKGVDIGGRKYDAYYDNQGHQNIQPKASLADRSKMWIDKKNKKLDNQRKQKEQQELDACTFKPQMLTQDQPSKNQQMYYNFLERIAQAKSTTFSSETASPLHPSQNLASRKNGQLSIQTGDNLEILEHQNNFQVESASNARYSGDPNFQKKIYNYILNIPN